MPSVETTFTIGNRVGTGFHLSKVFISTLVNIADHFKVEVQNLIEVLTLFSCFCKNHGQMQTHCTNIETSFKDRLIIFVCRVHTATLIPRTKESTATHRAYHSAIFLVHLSHITITCKRQPVRVHSLAATVNPGFKYIFVDTAFTVKILVIQEYQFREKDWLLISRLSLTCHVNTQESLACHLTETICSQTEGHSDKWIVTTG